MGGVFHVKGGGRKVRYVPRNQGNQTFWRDIPGFCRDIPEVPEKFEKNEFVFNLSSLCMKLSAPSPGDDLRSKSAIRLRGQTVRSDSFWGIGCDFSAVTIKLRLRCILR